MIGKWKFGYRKRKIWRDLFWKKGREYWREKGIDIEYGCMK